jgi:hypothetical protein
MEKLRLAGLVFLSIPVLIGSNCFYVGEHEDNDTVGQANKYAIRGDTYIAGGHVEFTNEDIRLPDQDYWKFTGNGAQIRVVAYSPEVGSGYGSGCYKLEYGKYDASRSDHFAPLTDASGYQKIYETRCNLHGQFVYENPRPRTIDSSFNIIRITPSYNFTYPEEFNHPSYRFVVSFF